MGTPKHYPRGRSTASKRTHTQNGRSAPTDPRDAATRVLAEQCRRDPDLLPASPDTSSLDERDASLARAIYETAIRRWETLEWLLQRKLERQARDLHPNVRAALLAGAAQIVFLDRVPAHAAINASVEWTKQSASRKASGLVNAVLRRTAEDWERVSVQDPEPIDHAQTITRGALIFDDGRSADLEPLALPTEIAERAAVLTGVPKRLYKRWAADDPLHAPQRAIHTLVKAPTIVHLAGDIPRLDSLTPHDTEAHAVWCGSQGSLAEFLRTTDGWVQDPSSSASIAMIRDMTPNVIIDRCAGLGTKTRQLARTFPDARIIATDPDANRMRALRTAFDENDQVHVVEERDLLPDHLESADLVLLDVPCSNSGVLARRLEARRRIGAKLIERLAGIQRQIIADAIPLLAPRGSILYATCSLEREENADITAWAQKWHGFSLPREQSIDPRGLPGEPPTSYRDGSYAALLMRG